MWTFLLMCAAGCLAGSPDGPPALETHTLDGFTLAPVAAVPRVTGITAAPGNDPDRLWVSTQAGVLMVVDDGAARPLLDLRARVDSGGETGLLGLAVSPRAEDRRVFVNYTYKDATGLHTRIAAFPFTAEGAVTDAEQVLLEFDQPYRNHNSGAMAFGSDGMLYLGVGDGGAGGDPMGTGQRKDDLLGSILRIDVRGTPYTIPPDNPFVTEADARGEVWAWGLRNPWGMHADGDTIFFADVGQNTWEEVNRLQRGGNYGWNRKEGAACFKLETCAGDYIEPLATYGRSVGVSVTGGVVYRGPSIPKLDGHFLYADFGTGAFFGIPVVDGKEAGPAESLGNLPVNPSTFGRDRSGQVYVTDYARGIYRFVPRG